MPALITQIEEKAAVLQRYAPLARVQDVEGIHELRVASRRLRAAMTEAKKFLRERSYTPFRERVRMVTCLLGKPRELDVSIALLKKHLDRIDSPAQTAASHTLQYMTGLRADVAPDAEAAACMVLSGEYLFLLRMMLDDAKEKNKMVEQLAKQSVETQFKAVKKAYRTWRDHKEDIHLHGIRISLKKLRYTCETYAPLFGSQLDELATRFKKVQQALGEWNDMRVLLSYVTASIPSAAGTSVDEMTYLRESLQTDLDALCDAFIQGPASMLADTESNPFR